MNLIREKIEDLRQTFGLALIVFICIYLSRSLGDPTSYLPNKLVKLPSSSTAEPHPHTLAKSLPVPSGITDTQTDSA